MQAYGLLHPLDLHSEICSRTKKKNKSNRKSNGQECPFHTSRVYASKI